MTADTGDFTPWLRDFEGAALLRWTWGDPDWSRGARLAPALVRSLQRFQVGEDGDGRSLTAKADRAGDSVYADAVRLFVAEEREHARLLGRLLDAASAATIPYHWTDTAFVRLRRLLGLRAELMVLMLAEVVALSYYRSVRDGVRDPLAAEVAGRILADELRHVPFHCYRLRRSFQRSSRLSRATASALWWLLLAGTVTVVALDHGHALREVGVSRTAFIDDVMARFRTVVADVMSPTR
ncbi:ferritin-like domain-containing protein [Planotetraspora sp. A-T 1434]|uniref:ferritin-like domain-containing protein n=1 Tax=Planotetraspora sp. A-T 1434 TaxID=2979219 RepID=UPI0021C1EACE|nr:ferritin-like domain-containing protein [Planotetraspora sp. A-T 1434]MCT9934654.1 ferritin-like domain-containing protein [Planotetraspora sp. A-T 1434]